MTVAVPAKGLSAVGDYPALGMVAFMEWLAYDRVQHQIDQESPIVKIADRVKELRSKGILQRKSKKGDHQAQACVENKNYTPEAQIRTTGLYLEAKYGEEWNVNHRLLAWVQRHAGWVVTHYLVIAETGHTAHYAVNPTVGGRRCFSWTR